MKYTKSKKILSILLINFLVLSLSSCNSKPQNYRYTDYARMTPEQITESLSLEQKAAQMLQPACYKINNSMVKEKDYGSILSNIVMSDQKDWQKYISNFQKAALASEAGIPFIYGQDDVHGVNYCVDAVYFPHNIGLGAANDPELMYRIGQITADEAKLCYMLWNFAPCLARSVDPRWGRTYESYGSDLDIIKSLGTSYIRGLQDEGIVACAKHYLGDGDVRYGTGEKTEHDMLIDRGDAILTDKEIEELLSVYQAAIDAGVKTIMISHSSLNGVKMHENRKYIEMLKNEMGFEGLIVSDWNSIQNTSPETYYDQVVTAINAGIDMLMEVDRFDEAIEIIVEAVNKADISTKRIDDAVRRIIKVKMEAGIFLDPLFENIVTVQSQVGSDEYRKVAEEAVEKSLVLIKNDNDLLPLKKGTSICLIGPGADNEPAQCGGWTLSWTGPPVEEVPGVTSVKEGFEKLCDQYDIKIVDNTQDCDVVILVLGEKPYAEWEGDSADIDLCGPLGLPGNKEAIKEARDSGKPVVTCIIAGRNVFIKDYIDDWDSLVMCYLPGSEGQGIVHMLCGKRPFTGKLPSPWYDSNEAIEKRQPWLPQGYGFVK